MEIALTGFRPRLNTATTIDASRQRQRQQQDVQRQPSSSDQRQSERQNAQAEDRQARAQARQKTPAQNSADSAGERGRVINGEVLSSETVRVNSEESFRKSNAEAATIIFPRRADNQQSPLSGQPSNRRIPVEQALQTFRDNEALVLNESTPRQVSGIIDEYV